NVTGVQTCALPICRCARTCGAHALRRRHRFRRPVSGVDEGRLCQEPSSGRFFWACSEPCFFPLRLGIGEGCRTISKSAVSALAARGSRPHGVLESALRRPRWPRRTALPGRLAPHCAPLAALPSASGFSHSHPGIQHGWRHLLVLLRGVSSLRVPDGLQRELSTCEMAHRRQRPTSSYPQCYPQSLHSLLCFVAICC